MKRAAVLALGVMVLAAALGGQACASWEVPDELARTAPEAARAVEEAGENGFFTAVQDIWRQSAGQLREVVTGGVKAVGGLIAGVLLLGVVEDLSPAGGEKLGKYTAVAGALWVTAVSAGDLNALIGLGRETVGQLSLLGKALLPVLAAATAAGGSVNAAAAGQVAAVFFSDLLLTAIDRALLPMVYLYIGTAAAGAVTGGDVMDRLGDLLKKGVTWALSGLLLAYTAFLAVSGAAAGAADARALKLARAAISSAVPVVGGILSDAAEGVLAGAGVLRGVAGTFGAVALLGACLLPFLHLGSQYLLYQGAALVSETAGPKSIAKLLARLGDAFGLVLAMVASAAVVLLLAVVAALRVVTP